ncbi:protein of unknown function [Bradyrhizobium vignae]|uniref:Uncharacterized protein n=1 Tax=Bradyrhizobium vignae TaxID=1549949 RepID=A0A2U3PVJ5_9BRAD|nr:protein of unknown function [Bradyrhizobium vignae]
MMSSGSSLMTIVLAAAAVLFVLGARNSRHHQAMPAAMSSPHPTARIQTWRLVKELVTSRCHHLHIGHRHMRRRILRTV